MRIENDPPRVVSPSEKVETFAATTEIHPTVAAVGWISAAGRMSSSGELAARRVESLRLFVDDNA
jgi:hypothetical protein